MKRIMLIKKIVCTIMLCALGAHLYGDNYDAEKAFTYIKSNFTATTPLDIDTFPETQLGKTLIQSIQQLSDSEKTKLLQEINNAFVIGENVELSFKETLYKIFVLAGGDINCNMGTPVNRKSMIQDAVQYRGIKFLQFLLDHGARTTDSNYQPKPTLLEYTSSYPKAELLIQHNALKPYVKDPSLQQRLLIKLFSNPADSMRLIDLYKNSFENLYGVTLDFKLKDTEGNSLLHILCKNAPKYARIGNFKAKTELLLKQGVRLTDYNNNGQQPLDIIDTSLERSPNNQALQGARIFLKNLLAAKSFNISIN